MVEFKFCPQCGAARMGRFCGGCGLDYLTLGSPAPRSETTTVAEEFDEGPALPELPYGLSYGEAFHVDTDCSNCGSITDEGHCHLCSAQE
jgi:hypothetical protein